MTRRWIDISHTFDDAMPSAGLPAPEHVFFNRIAPGSDPHNLDTVKFCAHTGTHMDAPLHVCNEWDSLEMVPADVLMGPALVITPDDAVPGPYEITVEAIRRWEETHEPIQEGDAVLFHTGHDARWSEGAQEYIVNGYPVLSLAASRYLVSKKVRFVGMESISVEGDSVDCHKELLGHGVIIVENLCNLGDIPGCRCMTAGTFPAIAGATGTWVRILAAV